MFGQKVVILFIYFFFTTHLPNWPHPHPLTPPMPRKMYSEERVLITVITISFTDDALKKRKRKWEEELGRS